MALDATQRPLDGNSLLGWSCCRLSVWNEATRQSREICSEDINGWKEIEVP